MNNITVNLENKTKVTFYELENYVGKFEAALKSLAQANQKLESIKSENDRRKIADDLFIYLELHKNAQTLLINAILGVEQSLGRYERDVDGFVKDVMKLLRGDSSPDATKIRQAIKEVAEELKSNAQKMVNLGKFLKQTGDQIERDDH